MLESLICSLDAKDWLNIILAIIGIGVSGGGLYLAISQIRGMKRTSEAVYYEVAKSQDKIRQTFDTSEITKTLADLDDAIQSINDVKLERVLMRMMDAQKTIENENMINKLLPKKYWTDFEIQKKNFHEAINIIEANIEQSNNIDLRRVKISLIDIRNYIIKVNNSLKNSVYDKND